MADSEEYAIDVEQLYVRYAPMVLRRCRQLLRDEESAVDAMQEVFARVLARRATLHGRYPSSLLYHIATNLCLNVIRNQASRRTDANEEALTRIACADEQETRTLAGVILDRLFRHEPPSTRTMAVLHFVDGLTLGEVADACGLSVSGVRKRLREFRRRAGLAQEE
jgi:RNA polymerase sigma-70 factor (ECF subfamily)